MNPTNVKVDSTSDNNNGANDNVAGTNNELVVDKQSWMLEWPEYTTIVGKDSDQQQRKPKTTNTNALIIRAALKAAEKENPTQVQEAYNLLSSLTSNSTVWRKRYDEIYYKLVQIQSSVSVETCVAMCTDSLNEALNAFIYRCQSSKNDVANMDPSNEVVMMSPQEALVKGNDSDTQLSETLTVSNSDTNEAVDKSDIRYRQTFPLVAPVADGSNNAAPSLYRNEAAIDQVNEWLEYGCLEQSAADHANATFVNTGIADDVSDSIFCILGITSELSPTKTLLQYVPNAHVIGMSRRPNSLIDWYKDEDKQNKIAPNTTLQVVAADILQEYPMISKWIINTVFESKKSRLIILPMGYMDGEANVRLTLAMDLITMNVIKSLSPGNEDKVASSVSSITVAYWTSPATVYVIPKNAAVDSSKRYHRDQKCLANKQRLLSLLSLGQFLQPNSAVNIVTEYKKAKKEKNDEKLKKYNIDSGVILNAVTKFQGPNYLLSKMLQQWRCIDLVYNYSNVIVLAPHAPPTRTISVTHSSQAAAGIEGIPYIAPPSVTFDVATCSTLMTAILLNQLKKSESFLSNEGSDSNSKSILRQRDTIQYPFELFWDGSVHGGVWRCPYNSNTVGIPAFLVGKFVLNSKEISSYFKSSNSSQAVVEVSADAKTASKTEESPSQN